METKTFEHESKTQKVHTYENDDLYPFAILEEETTNDVKDTSYRVILGNKFCDEKVFNTLKDCEEYIASKPYSLIFALHFHINELIEYYKNQKNLDVNNKNKIQKNETKQEN